MLALTTAVVAPLAVAAVAAIKQNEVNQQGAGLLGQTRDFASKASTAELTRALNGVKEQLKGMQFNTFGSKQIVTDVANVLVTELNRRQQKTPALQGMLGDVLGGHAVQGMLGNIHTNELKTNAKLGDTVSAVRDVKAATATGASTVRNQVSSSSSGIIGAIRSNRPITNVNVNVSATTIQQKTTVVTRYGPTGGDRNTAPFSEHNQ